MPQRDVMELEKVVPKKDQCLSVIVEDLIISLLLPVSGVGVGKLPCIRVACLQACF